MLNLHMLLMNLLNISFNYHTFIIYLLYKYYIIIFIKNQRNGNCSAWALCMVIQSCSVVSQIEHELPLRHLWAHLVLREPNIGVINLPSNSIVDDGCNSNTTFLCIIIHLPCNILEWIFLGYVFVWFRTYLSQERWCGIQKPFDASGNHY